MVTAGLKCAPEIWLSAAKKAATAKPCANATMSRFTSRVPCTYCTAQAAPSPKKTSAKVPRNSAVSFCGVLCIQKPPGPVPPQEEPAAYGANVDFSRNEGTDASILRILS